MTQQNKWKTVEEMLAYLLKRFGPLDTEEIYTMVSSHA